MSPPRRAIIAVTSAHAPLFEGTHTTGAFISEVLHPYNVLTAAGFTVDLTSEKGTYTPDWLSLTPDFLSGSDRATYEDTSSAFRQALDNHAKASTIDPNLYGVFFASAGHAALLDYPTAYDLKRIAATVWKNGGIVSSVCHGPAVFQDLLDPDTGEPLIKGRTITGFTTEAETVMGIQEELAGWKKPLVEDTAETMGATYMRAKGVWDDYHVVDGRLVTGQNPASATSTAKAVVEAFEKL
ncbi:class I glutamine amidotransferase-like protein [Podospora aff. communis PSN243]|uniref:D-lactate dehydratase n=1 Tax=Podospora aff. communis PSN243 TaxID=3040156 RepID=A0AAV9GB13_9PEZI|nr:class I glutamine amidotransferase-like protein [Podospora aff. communis PSN243]